MASRRQARRRALDIMYQSDVTGADPVEVVDAWAVAGHRVDPFARDLVEGVAMHRVEIDELLSRYAEGWSVGNVDTTVVLEAPRLAPHKAAMEERLAGVVGAAVSVKAKRAEGLGALGRGEGVACLAVALLLRSHPRNGLE